MTPPKPAAFQSSRWPTLVSLIAVLSAGLLVLAPPAGAAELRPLPPFDAISLQAGIDLTLRQTGREAVAVSAAPAVLPLIETVVGTTVVGGVAGPTLTIRLQPGQRLPAGARVRVDVELARLRALDLKGAGGMTVEALDTPALKLGIAGAGDIRLRGLSTGLLDIAIAGSGDVRADGRASQLMLAISGSGDAALGELAADKVQVSIAGSGDASVRASQAVTVSIAGSGDVEVLGNPPSLAKTVVGSGEVMVRR